MVLANRRWVGELGEFARWVPWGERNRVREVLAVPILRRYFNEDARAMRVSVGIDTDERLVVVATEFDNHDNFPFP